MMPRATILLLLLTGFAAAASADASFDGSKKMICSVAETHECVEGQTCERGTAVHVRLPNLIRIDVGKKRIDILDEDRKDERTEIGRVQTAEDVLFLQGIEGTRAWSAAVHISNGAFVLSVTDPNDAVTAFGWCVVE